MAASELRKKKKTFESVSKTPLKLRDHQILSDQHFRSYSDVRVSKVLNSKIVRNGNISQTLATSDLSLVSFESATKVV